MVLKRQYTHTKQRQESYYNPCTFALFSEVSGKHENLESLPEAFLACDTPVLTVLPNSAGAYPEQKDLYSIPGLEVKKFLSKTGAATIRYQGKTINLYPLDVWFTIRPGANLGQALKAKKELQKLLENAFQPVGTYNNTRERVPVPLVANPTQEGLMLLQHSLPYGKEYTCPPELAEALINFNLQGRIETFYHGQDSLDNLHYYDGRWFYAACLRRVPVGAMLHDQINEVMPYVPGFYRLSVEVPSEWNHIGLLPHRQKNGSYLYPRKPGETFEAWASYPEVRLALKHGWKLTVLERFLWIETEKEPEPLKMWGEKLVKLREETVEGYPEPYRGMFREAIRKLMLQAIGSFNRTGKEVDHYVQDIESLPEDTTSELLLPGDIWKYTTYQDLTPFQQVFYMPQWVKYIWGTARAKLAENALMVPFTDLVALRVDAVWSNCFVPYVDTGKVGQFISKPLKQSVGLSWPHNTKEMVKLVQQVKG